MEIYEVFITYRYAAKPDLSVTAPSGTFTTENRPTVQWSPDLDLDGGAQTHYQVRIFDADTYGDFSGVDPGASEPYAGIDGTGAATSWRPEDPLPDDDYRVYVRVAQTVNGSPHWSDWEYETFTIEVDRPAVPGLTLTPDSENARIEIDVTEESGDADTDWWEMQHSATGEPGTWQTLRTLEPGGVVINPTPGSSSSATVYDYEAGNGQPRFYRARAVTDHGDGLTVSSGWSTAVSASWESGAWWLKHPTDPALNTTVNVFSLPGFTRPSRSGRFQGLGSRTAIVVSDHAGAPQGEMVIECDDAQDRASLYALLDSLAPLLLQAPPGTHWTDRWISVGESDHNPMVDKLEALDSHHRLDWIEVERPEGEIVGWPE